MEINRANIGPHSDGIARVHGMANVQAEELVEYVPPNCQAMSRPMTLATKLTAQQVRLWSQGNVHEPRGRPGRCRVVRF